MAGAPVRRRLDAELVRRGLAAGRGEARALIEAGRVTVDGRPATKPATMVGGGQAVTVPGPGPRWASRGGAKLAGALAALPVRVTGRVCLDAGASTGGFTDVLLRAGASRVIAVDVGYGQLDWRLRSDERVVVLDRTNVRYLQPSALPPPPPQLVVADLSFISLRLVLDALVAVADPAADHLLMVKPQFEAGAGRLGKGGVVRDPAVWRATLTEVVDAAAALGLGLAGAAPSPLPGPAGNREFFVWLRPGATGGPALLDRAVAEAPPAAPSALPGGGGTAG